MRNVLLARLALMGLAILGLTPLADAMCGYFSRPIISDIKQPSVLQPSQIAFVTWDPAEKTETVTVQPRFEGSADDFGMVIPTPNQPKLHEMPRDFFKALATYTNPKRRVTAESKLMPRMMFGGGPRGLGAPQVAMAKDAGGGKGGMEEIKPPTVIEIEVGQVGNLDYKIILATRADDLFKWLKDNKYNYSGDEATLNYYVQKKYFFTVMKIDTLQMKRNKDGTFTGDITPTRFTFSTEKLVYPTRITQVSVKDKTEALFYVQAPYKVDLPGDFTYQYQWLNMLQHVEGNMGPGELLEPNRKWLASVRTEAPALLRRGGDLGFSFPLGQVAPANKQGHRPSSLEWAKKLTKDDIGILTGDRPYSEVVPDPDWGFTARDLQDPQRAAAIMKVIQYRVAKYQQDKPRGYQVREASKDDLKLLPQLKGHLQEGMVLTKFAHTFSRDEMTEDLVLGQAKAGNVEDRSEHEELLRTLTFGGRGPRGPFPGDFRVPPGGPGGIRPLQPQK